MQDQTVGWVKSIHETRYGELLGLVMVGPHVTDMIEVGVVAIDAESTVETVADGMAPHPTLAEAIKEAGPRRARPRDPHPEPQAARGREAPDAGVAGAARRWGRALLYARGMSIMNRRNAMLGWATWTVFKQILKRNAKAEAVEGRRSKRRRRFRRQGAGTGGRAAEEEAQASGALIGARVGDRGRRRDLAARPRPGARSG